MGENPVQVDSATLAGKLLDLALSGSDQADDSDKRYFDEFRFLSLFAVDYTLGLMATKRPIFDSVRDHYATYITQISDSAPLISHENVFRHFEAYAKAINKKPQPYEFWEVGKQFSQFLSVQETWVPHAGEVAVGTNYFLRRVSSLVEFLQNCDVREE